MSERTDRVKNQITLWNKRSLKDGLATAMCSDFSEAEARLADKTQNEVISRILKMVPRFNIGLEVGCGFGRLSVKWLEYADRLVAVDVSEGMLRKLPKLPSLHPIIADFVNLPLKVGVFDAIFISNTLGHLDEDSDLLASISEINRVSSPNCVLFLDEMIGQEGELIAGHYKIRNTETILSLLPDWSIFAQEFYFFGRQPHAATVCIKGYLV